MKRNSDLVWLIKAVVIMLVVIGIMRVVIIRTQSYDVNVPTQTREWNVADSKSYAKDVVQEWADNQYKCLEKLWTKESNWRPQAYNKVKVMGKNAGGIPQILGLNPKIDAPLQIDRGFGYIMHRYGTPCMAWKFHQKKGWY